MLILTRRVGESIVVGDDIVFTIFEVRGDAVRVGIEAPRSVQVHRQEVYDELKRLNEQSSSPSDDAVDALREALEQPAGSDKPELTVVADEPTKSAPASGDSAAPSPTGSTPTGSTPTGSTPNGGAQNASKSADGAARPAARPARSSARRPKPTPPSPASRSESPPER